MQNEGLTNAEFAEKLGISTSSLSHIFSGRNNPSLEVVVRIHKACPYVNLNWLLYGEGQMKEEENPVPDLFASGNRTAENAEIARNPSGGADFPGKTPQTIMFFHLKKL